MCILTIRGLWTQFTATSSMLYPWDGLCRFVAEKRCLTSLKMEGHSGLGVFNLCSSSISTLWLSDLHSGLGVFNLCSSSISTLWLSDLHCVSKMVGSIMPIMVFNCPKLKEISLDFLSQKNDSTALTAMVDGLGRSCLRLQNMHIASIQLSHDAVLALSASTLRKWMNFGEPPMRKKG